MYPKINFIVALDELHLVLAASLRAPCLALLWASGRWPRGIGGRAVRAVVP
jgi:hypothetical protein